MAAPLRAAQRQSQQVIKHGARDKHSYSHQHKANHCTLPVINSSYAISIFYGGLITGVILSEVPKNGVANSTLPDDSNYDPEDDYVDLCSEAGAHFDTFSLANPVAFFNMEAEVIQGTSVGLFGEKTQAQRCDLVPR